MAKRDFLQFSDLDGAEVRQLIARARQLKGGAAPALAPGKTLAMIFEKSSTRTRVSFEVGMAQLGGHALFLSSRDTQLGRGEPIADTARVLARMVDCVMIRNDSQSDQAEFAQASAVPVINGLSDLHHPCQILADLQTYVEQRGEIQGRRVAWLGDGNNVCHSFVQAAAVLDFELQVACPSGYAPDAQLLARYGSNTTVTDDPLAAARRADLVVTDVWASMGQEHDAGSRGGALQDYQVNAQVMALAASNALFMHCLPAHRGEEVSAEVIDGPQSVVWEEAGNRLHAQKALLEFLLTQI